MQGVGLASFKVQAAVFATKLARSVETKGVVAKKIIAASAAIYHLFMRYELGKAPVGYPGLAVEPSLLPVWRLAGGPASFGRSCPRKMEISEAGFQPGRLIIGHGIHRFSIQLR